VQPVTLPHCRAELVSANGISRSRAVLYMHGGALLTCGLNSHRSLVARLSQAADAVVLNVGYRKLPKQSVAEALADCVEALQWLRRQGYPPRSLVIGGDSAGGLLAFLLTLNMIEQGDCAPAGVATFSPLIDLTPTRSLTHPNARQCSMFSSGAIPKFAEYVDRCHKRLAWTASALRWCHRLMPTCLRCRP